MLELWQMQQNALAKIIEYDKIYFSANFYASFCAFIRLIYRWVFVLNGGGALKRIIGILLIAVMLIVCIVGCDNVTDNTTTAAATTTTTAATTTQYVPKPYNFMQDMNLGSSKRLTGDVALVVVMVDDDGSTWTDKDIKEFKKDQERQVKELMTQAKEYGVDLDVELSFTQCTVTGTFDRTDYSWWVSRAVGQTEYQYHYNMPKKIKEKFDCDEVAIVFATNRSGRSFAIQAMDDYVYDLEYVILYKNDSDYALNHELLHLFGAQDFYYPKDVYNAATKYFPDSIMLNSENQVDDFTAYLVGWTDELTDDAQAFLDETKHLTVDDMYEAHQEEVKSGYGTLEYPNGTYTGDIEDGIPHGKGVMEYSNGHKYDGEWDYGSFHGYGVYTYSEDEYYEGNWSQGSRNGYGKYVFADGAYYEGNFVDGRFEGKGKLVYANGGYYDGYWVDDDPHGKGTMVWPSGAKYVGDWQYGKMNGQGTYTYPDGEKLSGKFINDKYYG